MTFFDSLKKWFYTKNSSAASFDARVPLLDASGNPKGSDTMANLASVLGVMNKKQQIAGDFNNYKTHGIWYAANIINYDNHPSQITTQYTHGFLLVYGYEAGRSQQELFVGYPDTEVKVYSRTWNGDGWTSWQYLTYNIPSFYKNYADISSLASALGVGVLSKKVTLTDTWESQNYRGAHLTLNNYYGAIKFSIATHQGTATVLICSWAKNGAVILESKTSNFYFAYKIDGANFYLVTNYGNTPSFAYTLARDSNYSLVAYDVASVEGFTTL